MPRVAAAETGGTPPTGYIRRLLRRRELWWGNPFRWGSWRSYPEALRRRLERHTFRSASDPDALWRRGAYWQRTLVNKWNGREFARRHGAAVPELYWWGRRIRAIPFESLPSRFAIRPVWGFVRKGVHVVVDGTEILRGEPAAPADLRRRLHELWGSFRTAPVLVEQFVESEPGCRRLPVEYKCHTFAGDVAAIGVIERAHDKAATVRWYTPAWEPFPDRMATAWPAGEVRGPPGFLGEMLDLAGRMGRAIGTYMRIDFFGTDRGCVFNEFSSTPMVVKPDYTPFCNAFLEARWRERCPEAT